MGRPTKRFGGGTFEHVLLSGMEVTGSVREKNLYSKYLLIRRSGRPNPVFTPSGISFGL
jgi:hypothetical protein